jgi:hypothetical protein
MAGKALAFTFREMMSGGFSMGETDPARGHDAGRHTVLEMYNTIAIDDLDRFIAERDHPGSISGHINWAPLGNNIQAPTGVFNLFSPSDDPTLRLMVYELAFEHGGRPYYLAGHKEVRVHPIFDMWKDTTTLYTQLHDGRDTTGPVVGAGIVSLSPVELMKMIATFRSPNASSAQEEAEAVAKFGRFFMGELWETYVKRAGV